MGGSSLVVGLGNPLLGADGFGSAVVERLRARADLPPGTTLLDANTDLLGCLDRFDRFERVILVDAFVGGVATGAVTIVDEPTFSQWSSDAPDSHAMSAVLAVALFRRLYPAAATTIALVGLDAARADRDDVLPDHTIQAGVDAVMHLIG